MKTYKTSFPTRRERNGEFALSQGYILLELVIALSIFAIGVLGLARTLNSSMEVANILNKDYPLVRVGIEGHTDNTGKADANLLLSEKRAAAVKAYLVGRKVDIDRLDAVGYGQDQPIADNATAQGKAQNWRVAFKISEQ